MPDGCPITPLGVNGDRLIVLDSLGQQRSLDASRLTRDLLDNLFGRDPNWLETNFPIMRGRGDEMHAVPGKFNRDQTAHLLQAACLNEGLLDPVRQVRGRGAHRGENSGLILHLGDRLWIPCGPKRAPMIRSTGRHGGHIYPARPALPPPWSKPVPAQGGPGPKLFQLYSCWNWQRPAFDPLLMLGTHVVIQLAGALKVRPMTLLLGEPGSGKTTLLEKLLAAEGGGWLLICGDPTKAALMQVLGIDVLGVLIDQGLDATEAMPKHAAELLDFARAAYSGTEVWRGGADHAAVRFPTRSNLIAGAVVSPPLNAADASRWVKLELTAPTGPEPIVSDGQLGVLGQQLRRRVADLWPPLDGEVLPAVRQWLIRLGHDGRSADTYGTIFACAWIALHDRVPGEDDLEPYAETFEALVQMAREGREPTWQALLSHLCGSQLEMLRDGYRPTVDSLLTEAAGHGRDPNDPRQSNLFTPVRRSEAEAIAYAQENYRATEAAAVLGGIGIRLVFVEPEPDRPGGRYVAFANDTPQLRVILRDTPFGGQRAQSSALHDVLLRAPMARRSDGPIRFSSGLVKRAVLLPLTLVLAGLDVVASAPDAIEAGRRTAHGRKPEEQ
jgi:hypothetical protein